jgi:hypothetical protein
MELFSTFGFFCRARGFLRRKSSLPASLDYPADADPSRRKLQGVFQGASVFHYKGGLILRWLASLTGSGVDDRPYLEYARHRPDPSKYLKYFTSISSGRDRAGGWAGIE